MEVEEENKNIKNKSYRMANKSSVESSRPNMAKKRHKKALHKQIIQVLAFAVVFCTSYSLILDAITLSANTYCGLEEHTHTIDCYTTSTALCGLSESEGHAHTDDCYDEDGNLVCDKEESEEHTHTDNCYISSTALCGLEEHTHTKQCQSNPDAIETQDEWEEKLPDTNTEDQAELIKEITVSQTNYSESNENFLVNEDGTLSGWTRYGALFNEPYEDWKVSFINFILRYAGIAPIDIPTDEEELVAWLDDSKAMDNIKDPDFEYTIADLLFIESRNTGEIYMGFVTETDPLTMAAGNLNGKVTKVKPEEDSSYSIIGCLRFNLKTADADEEEEEEEPESALEEISSEKAVASTAVADKAEESDEESDADTDAKTKESDADSAKSTAEEASGSEKTDSKDKAESSTEETESEKLNTTESTADTDDKDEEADSKVEETDSEDSKQADKEKNSETRDGSSVEDDTERSDDSSENEDSEKLDESDKTDAAKKSDDKDKSADKENDDEEEDDDDKNEDNDLPVITLIPVDEDGNVIDDGIQVNKDIALSTSPYGSTLTATRTIEDTGAEYEIEVEYQGAYLINQKVAAVIDNHVVLGDISNESSEAELITEDTVEVAPDDEEESKKSNSSESDVAEAAASYLDDLTVLSPVTDTEIYLVYKAPAEKKTYVYENEDFIVTATASSEDVFPDDAKFVVTEITEETEGYNYAAYKAAAEEAGAGENLILLDLAFYMAKADDPTSVVEVQPEGGTVTFEIEPKSSKLEDELLSDDEDLSSLSIVHLPLDSSVKKDSTAEATNITSSNINQEPVDNTGNANAIEFTLDSLSLLALYIAEDTDYAPSQYYPGEGYEYFEDVGGQYTLEYLLNGYSYITFGDLNAQNHTVGAVLVGGTLTGNNVFGNSYLSYSDSINELNARPVYISKFYKYLGSEAGGSYTKALPLYLGTENHIRYYNGNWEIYGDPINDSSEIGWRLFSGRPSLSSNVSYDAASATVYQTDSFIDWDKLMAVVRSGANELAADSQYTISVDDNGKVYITDNSGTIYSAGENGEIRISGSDGDVLWISNSSLYITPGCNITISDSKVFDAGNINQIVIAFNSETNDDLKTLLKNADSIVVNFTSEGDISLPILRYTNIGVEAPSIQSFGTADYETDGGSVIWNFLKSSNITIAGNEHWLGHILAPTSTISKDSTEGNHSGTWIANTISSKSESHLFPYHNTKDTFTKLSLLTN